MVLYKFSYEQLLEGFRDSTFGPLVPLKILMSRTTLIQFARWAEEEFSMRRGPIIDPDKPMKFHGASIEESADIPNGCVVFIGGAHVVRLEKIDVD